MKNNYIEFANKIINSDSIISEYKKNNNFEKDFSEIINVRETMKFSDKKINLTPKTFYNTLNEIISKHKINSNSLKNLLH